MTRRGGGVGAGAWKPGAPLVGGARRSGRLRGAQTPVFVVEAVSVPSSRRMIS